jgi:hypothetical protein
MTTITGEQQKENAALRKLLVVGPPRGPMMQKSV